MRMLMMFGPMLYKMFQKYQRNNANQQTSQNPDKQLNREQEARGPEIKNREDHA